MSDFQTIQFLAISAIILALICGGLLIWDQLNRRAIRAARQDLARQNKITEKFLTVLNRNGVDVKTYLEITKQEIEERR